jgi:DNA-binding transcriptional MerR regulator
MATDLFTLRDLARELSLPESTIRYYRDQFSRFLPTVGTGRRRRYPPEAIGLLRFVADAYAHNRRREDIEAALAEVAPGAFEAAAIPVQVEPQPGPALPALWPRRSGTPTNDELLATILDGERDRREVMWQMAREIVRLGEAIERQHVFLSELSRHLESDTRLLPPASTPVAPVSPPANGEAPREHPLAAELEALRQELTRERELVDRLRKSKLEIERRAAEAEGRLRDSRAAPPPAKGGVFGRILSRDTPRESSGE